MTRIKILRILEANVEDIKSCKTFAQLRAVIEKLYAMFDGKDPSDEEVLTSYYTLASEA